MGLSWGKLVSVSESACSRIATKLVGMEVKMEPPAGLLERLGRELALNVLFFFMAINHDTRGLAGVVCGRYHRGSDFLFQLMLKLAEEDPCLLEPASLKELTLDEFLSWFSKFGEGSLPRRPAERVELLREAATKLLEQYGGEVSTLLEACGGRLAGPGGLRERLAAFRAFSDPLAKKTMVFAILARLEGLWEPVDPENITVGVDYHLQRVALRTGMVEVRDPRLREKLVMRRFVSSSEHRAIRSACLMAFSLLSEFSKLSQLELDQIFWHIGRNCCQVRSPCCAQEGPCWKPTECTLIKATNYECRGYCPLDGACRGSMDPEFLKLAEPKVITYYY